jgi:hypothetical protein
MKAGIDTKRILLMVAPVAAVLAAVVIVPVALERWEDRQERLGAIRAEKEALYRARLEPCDREFPPVSIKALTPERGEVVVDVFPSFEPAEGFILSRNKLSGYVGASSVHFPFPPPPPPPPESGLEDRVDRTIPEFTRYPTVAMPQPLGGRVLATLKREIDQANAELYRGFDGVTYILRYDDKCALAWSPREATRAHKIVSLVHVLGRLGRESKSPAEIARSHQEIADWLTELDSETRELAE